MEFKKLQKILSEEIAKNRQKNADLLYKKNTKLQLSDAFFCGEDVVKNRKFYEAIQKALKDLKNIFPEERIHVLDAGSGTGILGILALIS